MVRHLTAVRSRSFVGLVEGQLANHTAEEKTAAGTAAGVAQATVEKEAAKKAAGEMAVEGKAPAEMAAAVKVTDDVASTTATTAAISEAGTARLCKSGDEEATIPPPMGTARLRNSEFQHCKGIAKRLGEQITDKEFQEVMNDAGHDGNGTGQ